MTLLDDLEMMEAETHVSNKAPTIPNQDVNVSTSPVSPIAHPSTADALGKTGDGFVDKDTDSPLSYAGTVLADVTNDPSIADRTAEVPPALTPPRLSRKDGSSSGIYSIPLSFSDARPVISPPAVDASATHTDVTLPSLPTRPKPRPAYMSAAAVKAIVEAEASNSITILAAPGSPDMDITLPFPSSSPGLSTPQATSLNAVGENEEHGGRRRRKLTAFGVQHAKEIEEKNEKAAARVGQLVGMGMAVEVLGEAGRARFVLDRIL
ncbi:hypothetical protein PILCRDRAFT_92670 [Piloderma croceum F 1598]|uniref:Uncharacterized protein n=1 Tax=Piloderma croceum (strain F 1598) TaxID=765440 RepID=A0A0C3F2Y4_PILCF|nr:hypothetical protein PILCRDRAFT_92670 [Piloderma croceum F 1598]